MKDFKKTKTNEGQVIIIAALFSLFIFSAIFSIISSHTVSQLKISRDLSKSKHSFFSAENGNEDVAYRLKNGMDTLSISGINTNNSIVSTTITDVGTGLKEIISSANTDGRIRKLKNRIRISTGASFNYGLYSGQGGIKLDNNTRINGSIYSNGSIIGGSGVYIAGDVYVANELPENPNAEWLVYNADFLFGRKVGSEDHTDAVQSFRPTASGGFLSKMDLYLKRVGSPANLSIKVVSDKSGKPDKNGVLASGSISSSLVGTSYSFIGVSFDDNPNLVSGNLYWLVADMSRDDSNYYVWGMDSLGGFSNGEGKYSSNWTTSSFINIGGDFDFKLWLSEGNGVLDSVHIDDGLGGIFSAHANSINNTNVTGDVYASSFSNGSVGGNIIADSISNCVITGNASYNSSTSCSVGGTQTSPTTPPSDPPFIVTPISDANIDSWKGDAQDGGTISAGNFTPVDGQTLGPGVIEGNLVITPSISVNLSGVVYVKGNVQIGNGAEINISNPANSAMILTDKWFSISNGVSINSPRVGVGHIMMLALAACDGTVYEPQCNGEGATITVFNGTDADVLVAPNGLIRVNQNVFVVDLVADKLKIEENVILEYEMGLTNVNFSSGPSGSWAIDSWREIE